MVKKESIEDLAVYGGDPAFKEKLYVGKPNMGNKNIFLNYINDIIDRKLFSNNGPLLQEFEKKLSEFLGVKNVICVVNGTTALEIAIKALNLTGEVIVPSYTFIATVHSLYWQGIKPVFVDIDGDTGNIDTEKIEELITARTTGILAVNLYGIPANIDKLSEIAKKYNLKLLFDSAHAFACSYKGRMIGGFGDAEIFSFHATKFFNTIEGGAITTNDDELAEKLRLMRNFGFSGNDNVISLGINGKMNEFSAAMGLTNLICIDSFISANYNNYLEYKKNLGDINGINLLKYNENEKCNYGYIIIRTDYGSTVGRDELYNVLWAENIFARKYFYPPCHLMEPYKTNFKVKNSLKETEKFSNSVLALPTYQHITSDDIKTICNIIKIAKENYIKI